MAPKFEGCEQIEQIGRGGFGTVYRAYQTAFRRQVAVKVLSVGTSDDSTIRRFRREVGAVGSLSGHPHIVVVHDIGTTEQGDPYLVMAHLPGGTLTDHIEEQGPVPWRSVTAWTIKLAGALEAAHAAGVLHLDVKPDNVLFDEFGEPQLVDFGIARLEGVTHSRSSHVKATPLYAAPEVLGGARPSPSADVYSLTATAYAALRGRPAFLVDTDETLAPMLTRVLTQPPDPLPDSLLPAPAWSVLERGLAKDPADRHATPAELGRALQDAQRQLACPVTTMTIPGAPADRDDVTGTIDPVARVPTPESEDLTVTRTAGELPPAPGATPAGSERNRRRVTKVLLALFVVAMAVGAGLVGAMVLGGDEDDGPERTEATADIDPAAVTPADLARPNADNPAARPTRLRAEAVDGGQVVRLRWVNNAPAARGVAIQAGNRVQTVLLPDQDGISVTGVDPDRRTCFLVGAVGGDTLDWARAPACVVAAPPPAPGALTARRARGLDVDLEWTVAAGTEAGFEVRRGAAVVEELPPGREAYRVNGVDREDQACFTVVAFNEAGRSRSEEDCVPAVR